MDDQSLYTWLMDNGSPAIRIRTQTEILNNTVTNMMIADLLSFPMTKYWLSFLQPGPHFNNLHGSKPDCLENVGGKLHDLGFRVTMLPEYKERLLPFIDFVSENDKQKGIVEFSSLFAISPLLILGFEHPLLIQRALDHLLLVGDFCEKMDYHIHIDPDTYGGMYHQYQGRKLLNPDTNHRLPTIWDIYMLAYMRRLDLADELQQAEHQILQYILTDEYQNLPEGYGIMYYPPTRKYFTHGWNVNLPGWFGFDFKRSLHEASFIQRLELMSNFQMARSTQWFQNSLNHLETFTTEQGTYRFPFSYLQEGNSGYFVTGAYQRLEDNRRRTIALELDSTFRMELLKKRSENTK